MENQAMKIVVVGGTGLIGSKVVSNLRHKGHEVVAAAPNTGVNTFTGDGLKEALAGAQVVVDVANSPSFEDEAVMTFFKTAGRNLMAAEAAAGVGHHIALSVVETDRLPDSGYLRAKAAQEELIKAAGIPYTIVRATQFFEIIQRIAEAGDDGGLIRLSPALVQPIASDDVAAALTDVALAAPLNATIEVAGPEAWPLDKLACKLLAAIGDRRRVIADVHARYLGAELNDRSLTPGDRRRLGTTRFEDWLGRAARVHPALTPSPLKGDPTMKRLLVIGAGFAGMYAALSAARLRDLAKVSPDAFEITLVAPEPRLVIRPRLYERAPETMSAPLLELFAATDIRYEQGRVDIINTDASSVEIVGPDGGRRSMRYDRLVLAAGSLGFKPDIPGLAKYGFSVDQIDDAVVLDHHLHALASRLPSAARDTVVVAGGGFTGIEVATEMPTRLRAILGPKANVHVLIVDRNDAIAPAMGLNPRPLIEKALREAGVETKLGVGVSALSESSVTLSDKQSIESATVIWATGMRANPLTEQIQAERDRSGRLVVDRNLRVPEVPTVFAAGDTAHALTDDLGHRALMSCQHANRLGASAGHNAAADLLGVPLEPYQQKNYVTCLDLGPSDAVFTRGWDSKVEMSGNKAKTMKREINTQWIYPPRANRADAYKAAEWARTVDY
jgi:NADH dehydrogenase